MNRVWPLLLGLVLISACKSKPAPLLPLGTDAGGVEAEAAGEWTLTLPMVDGYLRYQRTLLVQAGKLSAPPWDGGLKKFEEPSVEQKADLDERARVEAGLTPEDVQKIEAIVSRVSARRLTYKMMKLDEKMPDLPDPDPEDPTKGVELTQAIETQTKLKKAMEDLPEERQAFGSRNVDVLLKREEEVLRNWALMMEVPELGKQ